MPNAPEYSNTQTPLQTPYLFQRQTKVCPAETCLAKWPVGSQGASLGGQRLHTREVKICAYVADSLPQEHDWGKACKYTNTTNCVVKGAVCFTNTS